MGWGSGYRNSGIVRIGNYEQALNRFETTKPIRNPKRVVECRPLGHRDRPHFSIKKDNEGNVICCDYNPNHETIVFKPNGEVQIKPYWVSISTGAFIQEVLGVGCIQQDNSMVLALNGGWFRIPREGITLKRDEQGKYQLLNAKPNIVHRIKRKEANNVRSKYVWLTDYVAGYIKLNGGERFSTEYLMELFGTRTYSGTNYNGEYYTYSQADIPSFDVGKPEKVQAFFVLAESGHEGLHKATVALCDRIGSWRRALLDDALVAVDRLILARHRDEVFKEVEVPVGVIRKDRYGWAFE